MIVPTDFYEIRIYDHSGNFKFIPQNITRLEIHQRTNAAWNHMLEMRLSVEHPDITVIRSIQDDWFVRIYRLNPVSYVKELVYEGFNSTTVDQAQNTGDLIFTLYGYGFTQLLYRRIVLPDNNSAESVKTGPSETVFKGFVSDCMVSALDVDRNFPGAVIDTDLGRGDVITYSSRYTNLLTVCENIGAAGDLDWGIIGGTDLGTFIVKAQPLWGLDRRVGNTAGNTPMIFSLYHNNMTIPILSTNASEEKNFAYVGGDGSEEDRDIEPVSYGTAPTRNPWARKEAFVEGRQQSDLIQAGMSYLFDNRFKQTLNFDILPVSGAQWKVNWDLGDLITARYFDVSFEKQIVQIDVTVTSQSSAELQETIKIEMQDV